MSQKQNNSLPMKQLVLGDGKIKYVYGTGWVIGELQLSNLFKGAVGKREGQQARLILEVEDR